MCICMISYSCIVVLIHATRYTLAGVHISERLMKATVEWKISEKVVAVVRDNAANMVLASQLLEDWDDLPCFGHTLQLAVKAGLDLAIISRLTAMCRKIVGHFKNSVGQ